MKLIKMFGLTALAALMAMVFVGASSAMAESTALCNTDPGTGSTEVCPAGHLVTHVHETTLSGAKMELLTNPQVECDVLFLGDVTTTNNLGNPLAISGNFTYTNCGSGCSVTEQSKSSIIKLLKLGHESADVIYDNEMHINCVGINCIYNGKNLEGKTRGPLLSSETNGDILIDEQETNKVSGLLCASTALLDITTTPLSATYITG